MANVTFVKSGYTTISFGRSLAYPVERPQTVVQVLDRTAGGSLQVENLGVTTSTRRLVMTNLSESIYDALVTWHSTVAKGALNTFTYNDENGDAHTVRWLDDTLNMPEYRNGKFSVEILLEIISTP